MIFAQLFRGRPIDSERFDAHQRSRGLRGSRGPCGTADRGFSFVEILVVMGIIAVLVGIGIGVYAMVIRKTPMLKAQAQVDKLRNGAEAWKRFFKAYPPSDLNRLAVATGMPIKIPGRLNTTNTGIEALYLALHLPAVDFNPDIQEHERGNLDDDRLDKALTRDGNAELFEIIDPWGNPYVYFNNTDYEASEKAPPHYSLNEDSEETNAEPKPWKVGNGFAQPNSFQLFSMGPDGKPNTPDDVKAWER
jgi:prepilin-type N-terminal cleavage/methylation domain-containing protein